MPAPAVRRATYDDVISAPPNMIAEIIDGTLHTQSRPDLGNLRVCFNLALILDDDFPRSDKSPGAWIFYKWPELHLGAEPDILVPDLAGWRRERLSVLPENAPWIGIAPDWVCEVLSPSTQATDRTEKMEIYLPEQVRHVWLSDPLARILEVYRHNDANWLRIATHRGDAVVHAEPFEAAELKLSWLWER